MGHTAAGLLPSSLAAGTVATAAPKTLDAILGGRPDWCNDRVSAEEAVAVVQFSAPIKARTEFTPQISILSHSCKLR